MKVVSIQHAAFANLCAYFFSDDFPPVGFLHIDLNPIVLSEDAPKLPSASDTQRDRGGQVHQRHLLDTRQVKNIPTRSLFLHRTRLQHLVHI